MPLPDTSSCDIQSHLYSSFLEARTPDVVLRVRGSWKAAYRLHRVVLIQSDFFRSLFTAGFLESSNGVHHNSPANIDVVFDDSNITRSAFEVCISRLYGGGPPLHISPDMVPSASHPLTPSFPGGMKCHDTPPGHQPATPRFLLSLLATAIYLSVPTVASQALGLILRTIGPHTVMSSLNFALGKSIDTFDPPEGESKAAVGLEKVAIIEDNGDRPGISNLRLQTACMDTVNSSSSLSPTESDSKLFDEGSTRDVTHHYGAISDKIGEASVCWLVRWATDMLRYEENIVKADNIPQRRLKSRASPSTLITNDNSVPSCSIPESAPGHVVIWARGGLSSDWVSALVSADTLFVKGERERYDFACSVVELRRKQGILEAEELVWNKMFEQGIYYVNMATEDLMTISQDISPTTNRPYVSLSVLQAAHWNQSALRHRFTFRPNIVDSSGTPQPSPNPCEKELGITLATADILASMSNHQTNSSDLGNPEAGKSYFSIPSGSSLRIGDFGTESPASDEGTISMDDLFSFSQSPSGRRSPGRIRANHHVTTDKVSTTESSFFGLATSKYSASACVQRDPTGNCRWSSFPPYRFAVEFWDIACLKDKCRLYSHTIWYGGSLFNVYIQVVRKKGQAQLGIYLHRQSSIDPIPASSVPSSPSLSWHNCKTEGSESLLHKRNPSFPSNLIVPSTSTLLAPPQPFRDHRSSVVAYFAINCASATGSSQTRFTSAPDVFAINQSWGWKSSSLRTEEYMEVGCQSLGPRNKEVSLRATVLLGFV